MDLEDIIRSRITQEEGLAFVDSNGRRLGEFLADKKSGISFTSDPAW
jgi:hypothetical protein